MDAATCRALGFREDGIADLSLLGLSPEAIAARRAFMGGSDANIIAKGDAEAIGKLRAFKQGGPPEDLSNLIYVMLGNWSEPFILAWAEKHHFGGRRLTRRGEVVKAARRPWMAATLDGWLESDPKGRKAVVQCKHVSAWTKEDEVQDRYIAGQVMHELYVTGAEVAYLCVLFGTQKFEVYEVARDIEAMERLVAAEEAFWDTVQNGGRVPAIPLAKGRATVSGRTGEADLTGNNAWADAAARWLASRAAADAFDEAARELKKLTPAEVKRAHGHGVEVVANKAGSLSVKPLAAKAAKEAA